jgi:prevent-host-death family protein
MTKVGVRQLKNQLSRFLARVKKGEVLAVTERGREIAVISPVSSATVPKELAEMVTSGLAEWKGGKPAGAAHPEKVRGRRISSLIIEDRR